MQCTNICIRDRGRSLDIEQGRFRPGKRRCSTCQRSTLFQFTVPPCLRGSMGWQALLTDKSVGCP